MLERAGLFFGLLLLSGVSVADQAIQTSTASGNPQTTIIDASGNLKVVESQPPTTTTTATPQTTTSTGTSSQEMVQTATPPASAPVTTTMPPTH